MTTISFLRRAINIWILIIVSAILLSLKFTELDSYEIYKGKITGFATVNKRYVTYNRGIYGANYGKMTVPLFEYYKDQDTVESSDGSMAFFCNFEKGESIKVLESKTVKNKVMIFSTVYFWIKLPEVIVFTLLYIIIFGFYKIYKKNPE